MTRLPQGTSRCWTALLASNLAFIVSCAPAPLRASFDSPNPTEKLYAIESAMRDRDDSAVPRIIEQLDSDDPAVRMIAITALERLTGETHGYVHYAPRHDRNEAIARWLEAYRAHQWSERESMSSGLRTLPVPANRGADD